MELNDCESCGRKTRKKELWGIAICEVCRRKYKLATQMAVVELLKEHHEEFEKIRDKKIDEVFGQGGIKK